MQHTSTNREHDTNHEGGAARLSVQVLGLAAAFAGVEHGVGEITQGWITPPSVVFESWSHVDAFDPISGEPAMSLVPNLLLSGVLSVGVSLAVGAWAFWYAGRRHAGPVLIGLSLMLLVVGGGFGPPLVGVLAGLLATRVGRLSNRPVDRPTRLAARLWPASLLVAAASFLALVPGVPLLHAIWGVDSLWLVTLLATAALGGAALTLWAAPAHDRAMRERVPERSVG